MIDPGVVLAWGVPRLRDLPWRAERDPWRILVAEVMLQQTQADRVIPKWQAFLDAYPDAASCADATLADVLRLWQGLGYPRRARNLRSAARVVVDQHGGRLPEDLDALLALPGIGPYTARAVLAFAFEHDVAVVDTNIARVLARTGGERLTPKRAQAAADRLVPDGHGWIWNQVLMDLGATVCRPRPKCEECPAAPMCTWSLAGRPDPDPAVGSAGVSQPQARFEGSDRQARGRVLAALHAGPQPLSGFDDRIISSLVADHLVEIVGNTVTLPSSPGGVGAVGPARDYGEGARTPLGSNSRLEASDHVQQLEAVIFDTDGVITQTAAVHFAAWKAVFDEFLAEHATGDAAVPFTDADYRVHVDGIGRYDGVDAFLRSRGFELPRGEPTDEPGDRTVCAVGNKKNDSFAAAIERHGVRPYTTTRRFIEQLHAQGIRTAVISASKNCELVLRAADMLDLFEVRVDGLDAAELGFPGKPAPDVFLEAAKRLGVDPERAAVVEDAISGVSAGRTGGFALVIGLDRTRNPDPLAEYADIVVPDLADLEVVALDPADPAAGAGVRRVEPARTWLPDLSDALTDHDLTRQIAGKTVAVFCDYDGALTPIVDRPEDAVIPPATLAALEALADLTVVGVVSGRDLTDVMAMVPTDKVWFAGSHGFDVRRPDGTGEEFPEGAAALPMLESAAEQLAERLGAIEGAWAERKRFAIAVHYRATPDDQVAALEAIVADLAASHDGLRMTGGKKIFELRPDIDWHKGKAVRWLIEAAGLDPDTTLPVFIGDDVTDEDGFAEVRSRGVGVVVGTEDRYTAAHLRVDDPDATRQLLEDLAGRLADR